MTGLYLDARIDECLVALLLLRRLLPLALEYNAGAARPTPGYAGTSSRPTQLRTPRAADGVSEEPHRPG